MLRQAIENEQKLLCEITLPGAKFEIKEVRIPIALIYICKIDFSLVCFGTDFLVVYYDMHVTFLVQSIITFVPTPPPTPPPPIEQPEPAYFTVEQVQHLHQQFHSLSPSGFVLVKVLVDTLQPMVSRSSRGDILPQQWRNASKQQVQLTLKLILNTKCIDIASTLECLS